MKPRRWRVELVIDTVAPVADLRTPEFWVDVLRGAGAHGGTVSVPDVDLHRVVCVEKSDER